MRLIRLPYSLSVCKVEKLDESIIKSQFFFLGRTSDEISLVCCTEDVLVKSPQYQQALDALAAAGYEIE